MPRRVLTPDDIMREGLQHMGFSIEKQARRSRDANANEFKKHCGPSPSPLATVWDDLCTTNTEESKLGDKEKGQKGLMHFLMAIFFLCNCPRNRHVLASRFEVCDKCAHGAKLWKWVSRVAGLKQKVIEFPAEFGDPNGRKFAMSLDCRDHKCWEKKHPQCNLDRSWASKKHGFHAGFKCALGIAIHHDQICWISGPHKPTRHDLTIFRDDGLKEMWLRDFHDKCVVVDLGGRSSEDDESMLAFPNSRDPLPLKKMKSMARCREEDVNGGMAKFKCLFDEFSHSKEKHGLCHTAVAVIVQCRFNCGDAHLPKIWWVETLDTVDCNCGDAHLPKTWWVETLDTVDCS